MNQSLPNASMIKFGYQAYPNKTHYLVDDEISVVGSGSSTFGFYIEANLADERDFQRQLKQLHNYYDKFRKNAINNIRRKYSVEAKLKPDFIFDYRRQKMFHPDGVLASTEIDKITNENLELKKIVEWLKSQK